MIKKLLIKVGGSLDKDLKALMKNPKKYAHPNTHTTYVKSWKEIPRLLSAKRLEMMYYLANYPIEDCNVSEIAHSTKRKQEAISRDLTVLEKNGLIQKTRHGQNVRAKALFDSIEIQMVESPSNTNN